MKITFALGFNGGQMNAECANFEEVDEVIRYAVNRGIITVTVPDGNGGAVQADVSANKEVLEAAEKKKHKVVRAYTKEEIDAGAIPGVKGATPEEAAKAVKDYAAKNSIEAGRALLAKFGLKRISEISESNASEIFEAARV